MIRDFTYPPDNLGAAAGNDTEIQVNVGGRLFGADSDFTWDRTLNIFDVKGSAVFNENGADYDFRIEGVGAPNAFFVQGSDGYVGVGVIPPYKFSIGSTDNSNYVGIYHNNTDGFITWDDGSFNFITDEATNTTTTVNIQGKGTGIGSFNVYDEDTMFVNITALSNKGYIKTAGTSAGVLTLQNSAHAGVTAFENAASGETQELSIYGYRADDSLRSLEIGVGVNAADTASFDGVSKYYFDGYIGGGIVPTAPLHLASGGTELKFEASGNNFLIRTDDDSVNPHLVLQTDYGTNTTHYVDIKGKGTGVGTLRIYDEDTMYLNIDGWINTGRIHTAGTSASYLSLQHTAHADIRMFESSSSGETEKLRIYGYRAEDAKRHLQISCGSDAADTASFDGLSNYYFDGNMGLGIQPSYKLTVGSNNNSNYVGIYHNNTDGFIIWDDGFLNLITDEGTNTQTTVQIQGKGTGNAALYVYDEDTMYITISSQGNIGYIYTSGTSPSYLALQHGAHAGIQMFGSAASGETQELTISGFRTGDSKRSLEIGVGIDAVNMASFDGVSNYWFDGKIAASKGSGFYWFDGGTTFAGALITDSSNNIKLYTQADGSNPRITVSNAGNVGIGGGTATLLELEGSASEAAPLLTIDQNDTDEAFVNFEGGTAADYSTNFATNNGSGAVSAPQVANSDNGWTFAGMVRMEINGATKWIPYYDEDPAP